MPLIRDIIYSSPKEKKNELILLSLLFALAVAINRFTPLPGGLIVMALFFILLKTACLKPKDFSYFTPFLLLHISFFFIPPAVKVVEEAAKLNGVVLKLIIILVVSNMLVMGMTGWVVQSIIRRGEQK